MLIESWKHIFIVKSRRSGPVHQPFIDVTIVVADRADHNIVVKLKGLDEVQHVRADGTVLLLKELAQKAELGWRQVLGLCQGSSLGSQAVQAEDAEQAFHVRDKVRAVNIFR